MLDALIDFFSVATKDVDDTAFRLANTPLSSLPTMLASGSGTHYEFDDLHARELMPREAILSDSSASAVRSALLNRGYVVFRGAIHPERVRHFYEARLQPAFAHYASLSADDIAAMDPARTDLWWGAGHPPDMLLRQCKRGLISNPMLVDASNGRASYFDLISDPNIHALLALAFPGAPFVPSPVTHSRRIYADGREGPDVAPPVPFHCDLYYHRDAQFALNFWIPLEPAGPEFGTPTLQTVDAGIAATARHLRYRRESPQLFDIERLKEDSLRAEFGNDAFVVHDIDVGDVILFTNWMVHRTYIEPGMQSSRVSAEVRLTGDSSITESVLFG